MTTSATHLTTAPTAAPAHLTALLESQVEHIQAAVHNTLRQHMFQNRSQLLIPRHLVEAAQAITQSYVHYLHHQDQEHLAAMMQKLVAQGLGHSSALAVVDTLDTISHGILAEVDAQALAVFHDYRLQFLLQYMHFREQSIITAREEFYQSVEQTLQHQVRLERELRQQLLESNTQLAREQGLLVSLLNSIPDLIFYKDVNGVYLGCNAAFVEFVGRPAEEIVGKSDFDLFPHEVAAFFREQDAEMMTRGQARHNDEWVDYPDGRRVLLDTLKVPFYDADKNLLGLIGISRNITAAHQAQEEIRRLGYMVEQSLDGMAVANLDGFIQFVNPAWAAMHGYAPDELIGQHLSIFHTKEQLLHEVEPINQIVTQTGQTQRAEMGHVRRDGSTFPTLMTIGLLRNEKGEPIALAASAQDISEQKAAEQELRAREARFHTLVDNIPGAVYRCAYDTNFTMEFLSSAIEEITQYPSTEFTTRHLAYSNLIYPEDVPLVNAAIAEAVAKHTAYTIEYRLRRADGNLVWVYEKGMAVYGAQDEVLWLDGVIFDISERKRSEATLARRVRQLQTVAEVGTAAAVTLEPDVLLQKVVNLAKNRFNLYHAHVYLLDEAGITLKLAAGAGEVGQQMVTQGWQIPLNRERSLVARVARTGHGAIVNDVQIEPDFLANPLLPNTRAELAVPIIVSDELLGVLDVQADTPNYFDDEDILIQTTLANQIGVALQNARSFARSEAARQELSLLTRRLTHEGWEEYLRQKQKPALRVVAGQPPENGQMLVQPLMVQGEQLGRLALAEPQRLAHEATEVVKVIVERLSSHIENLRLSEQTELALAQAEAQARRLAALNEMAAALNEAQETREIFQIAADQVLHIVRGTHVLAGMLNDDGTAITIMAASGTATAISPGTNLHLSEEPHLATAVHEAQVVTYITTTDDSEFASVIITPLVTSSRVLGVITVASRQVNAFGINEENLLRQVAALVSSTVENRYLFEETENRAEQLAAINRTAQALSQYLDRDELLEAAYQQIKQIMPLDAFFMAFYHPESNTVDNPIIYEAGQRSEQFNRPLNPQSYTARAITGRQPFLVNLVREEAEAIRQDPSRLIGLKGTANFPVSLIFVPLIVGQQVIGAISVQSYQYNTYTQADVNLLDGVGRYLAVSLENVRLFQQAQARARREQLLREITAKVRRSADVDTVMRTAVQEIGRTLGRKTFIHLQTAPVQEPATSPDSA